MQKKEELEDASGLSVNRLWSVEQLHDGFALSFGLFN